MVQKCHQSSGSKLERNVPLNIKYSRPYTGIHFEKEPVIAQALIEGLRIGLNSKGGWMDNIVGDT